MVLWSKTIDFASIIAAKPILAIYSTGAIQIERKTNMFDSVLKFAGYFSCFVEI